MHSCATEVVKMKLAKLLLAATVLAAASGCVGHMSYMERERQDKGLILILPGIEGESKLNHMIAEGLKDAGVPDAIDIYDWTGTRFFMVGNTMRYQRNLQQASLVAHQLSEYQRTHPGRPVHLIGHSGGGGLAVMVLEQMSRSRPITGAILLAPALSPGHNLCEAMRRTQFGIYNFWTPTDAAFLGIGTTTFGNMDREFGPAAGMIGFRVPDHLSPADARLYSRKLTQVRWRFEMLRQGQLPGHMTWANPWFVKNWLGKIVLSHEAGIKPNLD
jgi:pimeloyl-ACP methyl ester carboxylesterase